MPVAVMDVRIMRMAVPQIRMLVGMCMRLCAIPFKIMLVLVMLIVAMHVRVRHRQMLVFMRMRFAQVQPDAAAHQRGR